MGFADLDRCVASATLGSAARTGDTRPLRPACDDPFPLSPGEGFSQPTNKGNVHNSRRIVRGRTRRPTCDRECAKTPDGFRRGNPGQLPRRDGASPTLTCAFASCAWTKRTDPRDKSVASDRRPKSRPSNLRDHAVGAHSAHGSNRSSGGVDGAWGRWSHAQLRNFSLAIARRYRAMADFRVWGKAGETLANSDYLPALAGRPFRRSRSCFRLDSRSKSPTSGMDRSSGSTSPGFNITLVRNCRD